MTTEKEHELFVELKAAITAEYERRVDEYCEKNPRRRFDDLYNHEYTISGEALEEEAQEDSSQTLIQDIEHHLPKLADVMWKIMGEMKLC